jgi:hypothetical protein
MVNRAVESDNQRASYLELLTAIFDEISLCWGGYNKILYNVAFWLLPAQYSPYVTRNSIKTSSVRLNK